MKRPLCIILSLLMMLVFIPAAIAAEPSGTTDTSAPITTTTAPNADPTETTPPAAVMPPPVISFSSEPVSTYVEVTVAPAESASLAEGETIWYRTDDTPWTQYTAPVAIETNGTIFAKIVYADNTESQISHAEITGIDKMPPSPPEILADTATWVNDFVEVSVVSGSDLESGIRRNEYRLGEEGDWSEYTAPVQITAPVVFYARTVDMAGNTSSMTSRAIENFDTTPPDISSVKVYFTGDVPPVLAESGAFSKYYRSEITVTIDGAKDTQSGLAIYQYQFAGSSSALTDDGWLNYAPENRPVISTDFCGYVYVRAVDHAGNVSYNTISEGVVLDLTPPVIGKVNLTPATLTSGRVVVTFTVEDNYWLESVTSGGSYLGTYDPQITVFRNGEYTITAVDKAGNISTSGFTVSNIDSTPFSLLSVFDQLDQESFTPSTWTAAAGAANELRQLLTVESNSAQVDAASEKLTSSLEALVSRGDGTMSLELIERVKEYDKSIYTESSWKPIDNAIDAINACLEDPESTQADIDTARRTLEHAITELRLLADFTNIDRLIEQCEKLDKDAYDPIKFEVFAADLAAAKELSRTDSTQEQVDAVYYTLLTSREALRIIEEPVKEMPVVGYVIIGLLAVFLLTVLFILLKGRSHNNAELIEEEGFNNSDSPDDEPHIVYPDIGDICFTDSDDSYSDTL